MVEIFKTNVYDAKTAEEIASHLVKLLPGSKINFDLNDCDKILRVENETIYPEEIKSLLLNKGYICEILE